MTVWRIEEAGGVTRLSASALPPVLSVSTRLDLTALPRDPARFRRALAHQVRQDLWRLLARQRGFLPVVEVESLQGGLSLTAGGALAAGRLPPGTRDLVAGLLADAARRRRWCAHALRRAGGAA